MISDRGRITRHIILPAREDGGEGGHTRRRRNIDAQRRRLDHHGHLEKNKASGGLSILRGGPGVATGTVGLLAAISPWRGAGPTDGQDRSTATHSAIG